MSKINYCGGKNPLTHINVQEEYEYEYQYQTQGSGCNTKPHHTRSHAYNPTPIDPVTIPALGGDVVGSLVTNKVVAIQNIPVLCGYPKEGQILIINKRLKFELKEMAAIETLIVTPGNGLTLSDNELSVNCADLIDHCNLITAEMLEEDYLPKTGGTISGELILNGNLKLNELRGSSTQLLAVDSSGNVTTQPNTIRKPVTTSDSAAANNTIFYSSDTNKLSYKDPAGVVHALY